MLSFPVLLMKFLLSGAEAKTRRFTAHFHMPVSASPKCS